MSWRTIAELSKGDRRPLVLARLEAMGVPETPRVADSFVPLLDLPIFVVAANRVARVLPRTGSPGRAASALLDCVERMESDRGDASPLFVSPVLELLLEITGSSGRAARLLAGDPALAVDLGLRFEPDAYYVSDDFRPDLEKIVANAHGDHEAFDRLLRRYRNRQMLRIALRELRNADVRETAAELADFASAAVQAALDHHAPALAAQVGSLDPPCSHVVIGMGKFGGRELNFASDIDVIYLYEHDQCEANGLTAHEYHVKLFERVTSSLSRITEHGFVFRVDLDLRPEGKRGPLANSLAAAEHYYETWGRTWERAAWIKGRPIAGDRELGSRVRDMMRPFVYRKAFDTKSIEAIVEMKAKIDASRATRRPGQRERIVDERTGDHRAVDLKLGEGGIREIEFYVQAHQLLHGGRDLRLRSGNTLEALADLEAAGIVNRRTREILSDAYLMFRKIEHRIQIVEEQQTHSLPRDEEARGQIARSLGFASVLALESVLDGRMRAVHDLFVGLLASVSEGAPVPPDIELVLDADADSEIRQRILTERGATDPMAALANLMTATRLPRSPFHPHADEAHRILAKRFLLECWASPSVDRALRHLPDLVRSLVVHGSFVEHLERSSIRRGVARVLGASDLLARILVTNPQLLPNVLVSSDMLLAPALDKILADRLEGTENDVELAMNVLRTVKQEEILRVAIADLAGEIDVERVGERLSRLAELLLAHALEIALREATEKYGPPEDPEARVVVVSGGTLGAEEMGYRSDLDLSVIYEGQGETRGGARPPIVVSEFFTRVTQRLLSFLTMKMKTGDLYEVDMRLRPSGNQGPLVTSLESFRRYHEKTAQLWERQALLRARPVAGAEEQRARVEAALDRAAYASESLKDASIPKDTAARVDEMRQRMERERSMVVRKRFRQPTFDLKLGRGGLIEVEFLVQFLQIRYGPAEPRLRTRSTREGLRRAGELGLLAMPTVERLEIAYNRLRRVQNWLRIAHDEMIDHVFLSPSVLRPLALAVGYEGADAQDYLGRDLRLDAEAIHAAYAQTLGLEEGRSVEEGRSGEEIRSVEDGP